MTAEEIVRKLASQWAPMGQSGYQCELCYGADTHEPDCPWRLAREWVEANPQ